jgi:hypothetical protein
MNSFFMNLLVFQAESGVRHKRNIKLTLLTTRKKKKPVLGYREND